jgi:two-component system nitrogen regulation sensor histidine kinase GlnL
MNIDLLDQLQTAVIALDHDGRVSAVNSAAEDLLAMSRRQLVGQEFSQWLSQGEPLLALLDRASSEQRAVQQSEVALQLPLKPLHWLHAVVSPIDGGLIIELFPADEAHRLARDAERAQRGHELLRVLSNLAHEIKNPLAGLRGSAQLLARELNNPELREYTDLIQREADRLRALVERLLSPAKQQPRTEENIHAILDQVISVAKASHPQATITRDYDPSLPSVRCVRDAMTQVLMNLLQNALEAVEARTSVNLRTRVESGVPIAGRRVRMALRIDVIDHGPGIAEAVKTHLFLPLQSTKPNGTGLGLSIAQSLMQQQDGVIECDSRPGHTQFTVWLPMETR